MPIILWFDDGLLNTYEEAWPMMEKYGFPGNIAVITGWAGNEPDFMNVKQLKEISKAGWQLHSHGVNHQRFSEITEIEALLEIKDSKQWFDTYLNLTPICFVYPYGVRAHKNIVRKYYNYERPSNYNTISLWNGKNRKIPTIYSSRSFLKVSKKPFVYTNILFHSVVTNPQQFWNNSPKQFKEILNNIYKNKIEVITLSEAIKRSVKHTNTERAKHFLITKFWGMNEFARSIAPSGT